MALAEIPDAPQPRPRILIVEDYEDQRIMLARYLRHRAFDVDVADSAETARDRINDQRAAGTPYAVFIFDVGMPKKSGVMLAEELRAGGDETPLIFLTGQNDDPMLDARVKSVSGVLLFKPEGFERVRTLVYAYFGVEEEEDVDERVHEAVESGGADSVTANGDGDDPPD
jgi:CheY-like chemotaxis protein